LHIDEIGAWASTGYDTKYENLYNDEITADNFSTIHERWQLRHFATCCAKYPDYFKVIFTGTNLKLYSQLRFASAQNPINIFLDQWTIDDIQILFSQFIPQDALKKLITKHFKNWLDLLVFCSGF